jgi:hypothetical protein
MIVSKKKKKRRGQGNNWVKEYKGNNILHDYKRKFKIQTITAINDLQSLGVRLDEAEVARIKLDRHHNGEQQINKKALEYLSSIIDRNNSELY